MPAVSINSSDRQRVGLVQGTSEPVGELLHDAVAKEVSHFQGEVMH